jgi:hypothetical protein
MKNNISGVSLKSLINVRCHIFINGTSKIHTKTNITVYGKFIFFEKINAIQEAASRKIRDNNGFNKLNSISFYIIY